MESSTWYRISLLAEVVLKIVLRMERARPPPFCGDEEIGALRFWQILGRNMLTLGDWLTRWISRL
jgi:hypothetical protein